MKGGYQDIHHKYICDLQLQKYNFSHPALTVYLLDVNLNEVQNIRTVDFLFHKL